MRAPRQPARSSRALAETGPSSCCYRSLPLFPTIHLIFDVKVKEPETVDGTAEERLSSERLAKKLATCEGTDCCAPLLLLLLLLNDPSVFDRRAFAAGGEFSGILERGTAAAAECCSASDDCERLEPTAVCLRTLMNSYRVY